jgi:hypothetical protein
VKRTAETFVEDIERLVSAKKLSHLDAVLHWCQSNGFEAEYGASLVKKSAKLKRAVKAEAEKLNCLRK